MVAELVMHERLRKQHDQMRCDGSHENVAAAVEVATILPEACGRPPGLELI